MHRIQGWVSAKSSCYQCCVLLRAGVAGALAEGGVNVSYMTVTRTGRGLEAIMAIGIDGNPPQNVLDKIPVVPGIIEMTLFSEKGIKPLA